MSILSSNEICYICQEECPDEMSPCKCKIPVHQHCMNEFRRVSENSEFRNKCSVCQGEYTTIPIQPTRTIQIRHVTTNSSSGRQEAKKLLKLLMLYIILGYIGKLIMFRYDNGLEIEGNEYWNPMNFEHACYSIIVYSFLNILNSVVIFVYKRQPCCIISYETFQDESSNDDSDSDNDDSYIESGEG